MKTNDNTLVLWFDLETTGLSVQTDVILEVGAVLTSYDGRTEYFRFQSLVNHYRPLAPTKPDDVVQEMHEKSGLWADRLKQSEMPKLPDVDEHLAMMISNVLNGIGDRDVLLGGSGVAQFDLRWVQQCMSMTYNMIHGYQTVDVSSIRKLFELVGSNTVWPGVPLIHRALPDALQARGQWVRAQTALQALKTHAFHESLLAMDYDTFCPSCDDPADSASMVDSICELGVICEQCEEAGIV